MDQIVSDKELNLITVVAKQVIPLKIAGFETIMINCNPETVSTDYDTSDRLYFEPLKEEYIYNIIKKEQQKGNLSGNYCSVWRTNSNKACKIFK